MQASRDRKGGCGMDVTGRDGGGMGRNGREPLTLAQIQGQHLDNADAYLRGTITTEEFSEREKALHRELERRHEDEWRKTEWWIVKWVAALTVVALVGIGLIAAMVGW